MFLGKNARLSARVFGRVLNFPLYDADCCPAARECLAIGNVAGAIVEWQRLADLGSGSARCVLAYVHLMGAPSVPVDLEEARRIALSAVSGARGYANYLLGCIALRERQPSEAVKYLVESTKAGFVPAMTHLALLLIRGASQDSKRKAVDLLRKSAAAGHCPALLRLAGVYLSGEMGFPQRAIGLALLVPAFVRVWFALKYQIFSIQCFQVMASATPSLFNEEGTQPFEKADSFPIGVSRRAIVRWAHAIAAIAAAVVLVSQSEAFARPDREASALVLAGWGLLGAWPYGFSYFIASTVNTRTLISTLVQTTLLCLITTLVCSAYSGQLFDTTLHGWEIAAVTVAQAFFLLAGCGLGERAAQQVEGSNLPIPPARHRVVWAHAILGLVAAGSWLSRSEVWRWDYLRHNGFDLASYVLLATLPYLTSAVLSWQLVTTNRCKPWAYVGILILGTALAVVNNTGLWVLQPGLTGVWLVLMVQFIGFIFMAEWALDEAEW